MTLKLTPHGQTQDICEFVVEKYKDNPTYEDNKTVQEWVKASEVQLTKHKIRVP